MRRTKRILFVIITFAFQGSLLAQNTLGCGEIKDLAQKQSEAKKYALSFITYSKAIGLYEDQFTKTEIYNAACIAALAGKKKKAIEWVQKALQKGFTDADHLQKDPDFYSLHGLQEWPQIVEESKKIQEAYNQKSQFVRETRNRLLEAKGDVLYKTGSEKLKANYPAPLFEGLVQRISQDAKERNIWPSNASEMTESSRVNNLFLNSLIGVDCYSLTIPIVLDMKSLALTPIGNDVIIGIKFIQNEWRLDSLNYRLNFLPFDPGHALDSVRAFKSSGAQCSWKAKGKGVGFTCPTGVLEDLRTSFTTNTFTQLPKAPDLWTKDTCAFAIRIDGTNIFPMIESTFQVMFFRNSDYLLVSDENRYSVFKSNKAKEMYLRYKEWTKEKVVEDFFR